MASKRLERAACPFTQKFAQELLVATVGFDLCGRVSLAFILNFRVTAKRRYTDDLRALAIVPEFR